MREIRARALCVVFWVDKFFSALLFPNNMTNPASMKTGNLCYRQTLIILERLALVKFDSVILHNSECDPSDCQWDPEGNTAKGQSNQGGHVQQPGCPNHQRQKTRSTCRPCKVMKIASISEKRPKIKIKPSSSKRANQHFRMEVQLFILCAVRPCPRSG